MFWLSVLVLFTSILTNDCGISVPVVVDTFDAVVVVVVVVVVAAAVVVVVVVLLLCCCCFG